MNEKYINELAARDKRYKEYLGGNLLIEIHPTGRKVYRVKHPHKTVTIGSNEEYSYKQARILADKLNIELREVKQKSINFGSLLTDWLKHKDWVGSTRRSRELLINKHLSLLNNRRLEDINKAEIIKLIRGIEEQGYASTARRVLGILQEIFDYAIVFEYIKHNPAYKIETLLKKYEETPRKAFTKEEDIRRLLFAIDEMNTINKALFEFTMYTLVRPSEARLATWDEIDGNTWTIPKEKMKMRKEHVVILPSQCMKILEEMKKIRKNDYVFPSPRGNSPLSEGTLAKALKIAGISNNEMTIHGLRAMGSTILNEQLASMENKSITSDVIERALAHCDKDKVRAIYNRAEHFKARADLLQYYADYLNALKNGEKAEE